MAVKISNFINMNAGHSFFTKKYDGRKSTCYADQKSQPSRSGKRADSDDTMVLLYLSRLMSSKMNRREPITGRRIPSIPKFSFLQRSPWKSCEILRIIMDSRPNQAGPTARRLPVQNACRNSTYDFRAVSSSTYRFKSWNAHRQNPTWRRAWTGRSRFIVYTFALRFCSFWHQKV